MMSDSVPFLKRWKPLAGLRRYLNNQYDRDKFVISELKKVPRDCKLLDVGCGNQRYRAECQDLQYFAQGFAKYTKDEKTGFHAGVGGVAGYE